MAATIRTAIGIAIGLSFLYWLLALLARNLFEIDVPDPADILPYGLRRLIPYR